jgi:hypothetical protein
VIAFYKAEAVRAGFTVTDETENSSRSQFRSRLNDHKAAA